MIRMDSFVVVTLRNDSYASVCRSSLHVNQSLQFAFISYKYIIAKIRDGIVLDRLICKLAGHNLMTCDIKR